MTEETLNKIDKYLRSELIKLANYNDKSLRKANYRIEHSYRVAYIAKDIAKKEGFSEDMAFIAGLFHDIGYAIEYKNGEGFFDHGRLGAKLVRPFIYSLGYSEAEAEEICYAIAIHVDYKADFEFENTKLALSIIDADYIDRLDAFRLYEGLHNVDYKNLSIKEQGEYIKKTKENLNNFKKEYKCATVTAQKMLDEKICYQIEFLNRLNNQVIKSY